MSSRCNLALPAQCKEVKEGIHVLFEGGFHVRHKARNDIPAHSADCSPVGCDVDSLTQCFRKPWLIPSSIDGYCESLLKSSWKMKFQITLHLSIFGTFSFHFESPLVSCEDACSDRDHRARPSTIDTLDIMKCIMSFTIWVLDRVAPSKPITENGVGHGARHVSDGNGKQLEHCFVDSRIVRPVSVQVEADCELLPIPWWGWYFHIHE